MITLNRLDLTLVGWGTGGGKRVDYHNNKKHIMVLELCATNLIKRLKSAVSLAVTDWANLVQLWKENFYNLRRSG